MKIAIYPKSMCNVCAEVSEFYSVLFEKFMVTFLQLEIYYNLREFLKQINAKMIILAVFFEGNFPLFLMTYRCCFKAKKYTI